MKKFILAILLVLSIVGIFSFYNNNDNGKTVKSTSMEFFQYDSIKQLTDTASDIIKGKIIKKETRIINTMLSNESQDSRLNPEGEVDATGELYTVYTITIDKVYKGKYQSGDNIEIKQLGGETEEVIHISDEQLDLNEIDNYVFFVQSYENIPASILNPTQSSYIYTNEASKSSFKTLESVNNDNDLSLTYDELNLLELKLQEYN